MWKLLKKPSIRRKNQGHPPDQSWFLPGLHDILRRLIERETHNPCNNRRVSCFLRSVQWLYGSSWFGFNLLVGASTLAFWSLDTCYMHGHAMRCHALSIHRNISRDDTIAELRKSSMFGSSCFLLLPLVRRTKSNWVWPGQHWTTVCVISDLRIFLSLTPCFRYGLAGVVLRPCSVVTSMGT